ncbi:histone H4 transcription factor, partial [Anopheles maculipalpis]|uniref:histone H4 transcription factor n=1 Tax=Anopheles maculipalpis TaxID=1496333 RepID=UPI00215990F2
LDSKMDKGTKRQKKQAAAEGSKDVKKLKLAVKEEPTGSSELPTQQPVPVVPENDPNISRLRKDIHDWMEKQAEYESADLDTLLEESNHLAEQEEIIDLDRVEAPLKKLLNGYSDEEIRKSIKYECEWRKCTFMSGNDRKYFLHVESHAELAMVNQSDSYTCEWDLCGFTTEDDYEYMGHIHYHAYHTKLKVHGAGVHMLAKLPSCNNDSRLRNTITNSPVTFRCEWNNCNERFNKAMHFFHHVRNHICDEFPTNSKTSESGVDCLWSLCKERFKMRYFALLHVKKHTTERDIACYTCGTTFWARLKLVYHLIRQIEMSQRKYNCSICGRFYATNALLKSHAESHEMSHQCTLCPLKTGAASMLAAHMLRVHLKQRNFKCNRCEYAAFSNLELKSHMRTHDKTKIFRCEEFGCNVAYRSLLAMKKHFAWHYNLPTTMYGCHICTDKTYKNAYHLTKHLRFVHKLERAPGYFRFAYKPDTDGINRLSTYVEQKLKQTRANNATSVSAEETATKSDQKNNKAAAAAGRKAKSNEKAQEQINAALNQQESSHDASAYAPIKGKPKINFVKAIGVHEFLVELGIEKEPAEAEQSSVPVESVDSSTVSRSETTKAQPKRTTETVRMKREKEHVARLDTSHDEESSNEGGDGVATQTPQQPKDVKDFTVMRRYLKSSKKSV